MLNEERQDGTKADSSTQDEHLHPVRRHNTNAFVGRSLSDDDFKSYVRSVLENRKEHYKNHLKLLDFQGFTYDDKYNVINGVLTTPKDFPEFERHVNGMRDLLKEMKLLMALLRREAL